MNTYNTRRMRGITLMELMIVVVIVGILSAIAYPNYRQYAARAKRTEATTALLQIAGKQETFYLNNNAFTLDMTQLGFPVAAGFITDTESYTVTVTAADANTFSATATYRHADSEAGKCQTFSIAGGLVKTSGPLPDCWSRTR